jgi:DNA repair photolyase
MLLPVIENRTILTPTSGFLGSGFTYTINAYVGCAFAKTICGGYCYAQHNYWITKGRTWGLYGTKRAVATAYRTEYDRLKSPRRGAPQALRIFMSSSTDPYLPQERSLGLTRSLLETMLDRPPDGIVIQSHATLIAHDLALIAKLAERSAVWVSLTIETDLEAIPGFPSHASSPAKRLETLLKFREAAVPTQATVSPLLPIANVRQFAEALDRAADRVILDHYLLGDGSPGGLRTKRTAFPQQLSQAGYGEWNTLDKFWEVVAEFRTVLTSDRVLISEAGFNAV